MNNKANGSVGRISALAAILVSSAITSMSNAQRLCTEAETAGRVPVFGTVGYTAAFGAFERVALAYGAASMLEKRILPMLRIKDVGSIIQLDVTSVFGALQVPLCSVGTQGPVQMGSLDLGTGGFGAGMRFGPLTVFYAGNATYRAVRPDFGYGRWVLAFGVPVMGSLLSPITPIYDRYDGNALTISADFITGLDVGNTFVHASAGYVASNGLYGNVTSPVAGLFGSAVVGTDFETLPVATTGFSDFDWLVGDLRDTIGSTSLYMRRLSYAAAPPNTVPKEDLGSAKTSSFAFTTVHVEQWGIGQHVDLLASITVQPKKEIYDVTASYHSEGFLSEQQTLSRATEKGILKTCAWGVRASLGAVKLPVLWTHGSRGGVVPRVSLDLGGLGLCDNVDGATGPFMLAFALNSPEIVSMFPFARNVFSVVLRSGWGGR